MFHYNKVQYTSEKSPDLISLGKRVFVPKIADEIHDFSRTKWGIPEPPQDRPELSRGAEQLSKTLLVVPAVAFNYDGTRLGYGGGYYDKFLSELSPSGHIKQDDTFTTIGIGFKCQLIERPIPTNETDFCLDEVRVF
ncbi:Probable 5-formyltetrahydrofolate cyclo-ligase [Taphrina deformans PYCC 5710]|uniref:5-formyltetrahydrofolate cyclo-ligase n=1 Tax=Taphrina deformans (strain PYCC 5710 / ATCC 11124 / CBS 356.35 / IMI 108563 / JCM 9778 / NBRC 8474) TaxID=1097556 RepID=R4XBH3_TAPDE|nr:Probable 5-formyltetrahydrofolate cyclo-ligase [Taphrina deformans PYCC 5710]|eukprot:CCG82945.1 Probable 5-formyltetrahydrofolate cyclo-ligase [Taphrina deformans PYCC 5710]